MQINREHMPRSKCWAVLFVALLVSLSHGEEFLVTPSDDLAPIIKQLDAGDEVVLADGEWNDVQLKFERLPGTKRQPIVIRAQTVGNVEFTGKSQLRLSGNHVTLSGLAFRDTDEVSDVVQLRTHSRRHAHNCRVTDCVFEQTSDGDKGKESRWLSIYGTNNRVDHCYFGGKRSRGPTLVVWVSPDMLESHRIDHNYFGPRPNLRRNGGETIRIGTSEVSEANCGTVVEDNYFHRCNGEAEIISNKSCENTYRHNVFVECEGALTLRHGHRCLVDGNIFLGNKKNGTGGVRIVGESHTVVNNYFEGLRGDARRAALSLMNGIADGPLNGFAPVRKATIAHNTFIDCKVSLELGVDASKGHPIAPKACRFTHNLFLPGKWPIFRVHAMPTSSMWEDNKHQIGKTHEDQPLLFERVDLQFARARDSLFRPTKQQPLLCRMKSATAYDIDGQPRQGAALAGCDVPGRVRRIPVSASDTGPSWQWQTKRTSNHQDVQSR